MFLINADTFNRLTMDYNLELRYREPFLKVWEQEKDDKDLGPLSERMGVRNRDTGRLMMTEEEKEAASMSLILFSLLYLFSELTND